MAVLRRYVENQTMLEPILLYQTSKCERTKEQGSEDCLQIHIFTFYKIIFSYFFLFFCQDANKTRSNCAIIGCNLSKKHKLTLYKTQYKNVGTDIQILQSWLVGQCMYCVTLRVHNIKNLQQTHRGRGCRRDISPHKFLC